MTMGVMPPLRSISRPWPSSTLKPFSVSPSAVIQIEPSVSTPSTSKIAALMPVPAPWALSSTSGAKLRCETGVDAIR